MPKLEVEVGENGEIGTLPEPIQKHLEGIIGRKFADVKSLEAQIATLTAKADPVERERLKALELENSRLKEAEAMSAKNYAEAEKIRNERHATELKDRDDKITTAQQEIARRTERVRDLLAATVRETAVRHGARDASLDELAELLGKRIDLDDALQPIVKDSAGKAALDKDGKPVTVEGLVSTYLTDHPHHKAAPGGRGGGASGGRSLSGSVPGDSLTVSLAAVSAEPSQKNLASAFRELNQKAGAA